MPDTFSLAQRLYAFARAQGFVAPDPYYIHGELRGTALDGSPLYSDEAHLWCRECADALLSRFLSEVYGPHDDEHAVYPVDVTGGEDTPAHCMACGETLDHLLTGYGVREELAHYEEHATAVLNPFQAWELACLLESAPNDPRVLKVGIDHCALIDAGLFVTAAAQLEAVRNARVSASEEGKQ